MMPNRNGAFLKTALVVLVLLGLWSIFNRFHMQQHLNSALAWISLAGAWGYAAFILVYALCSVLLIPGSILTLGAGAVFGIVRGSILVSAAATLGATLSFWVGRYAARGWVSRRIAGYPAFRAVDRAIAHGGWKVVFLSRLSPIFPFVLLNYAFGITSVSTREYVFASWIGMLPGTILYVYLGSLAGTLAAGGRQPPRSAAQWFLYVIGLFATFAVTLYITRTAKKAMEKL